MVTLLELILTADKDIFSEEILPQWHTHAHIFFFKVSMENRVQTKLHRSMSRVRRTSKLKKHALMYPLCPLCGIFVQAGSNYSSGNNYKKPGNKGHVIEKSLPSFKI
jgi:hypothetical protein